MEIRFLPQYQSVKRTPGCLTPMRQPHLYLGICLGVICDAIAEDHITQSSLPQSTMATR